MLNTRLLITASIFISLSSTVSAVDIATTAQESNNIAVFDAPAPAAPIATPSSVDSNVNNTQNIDKTTQLSPLLAKKIRFLRRSVGTIGEIGSRSIQNVTALGSKIAVDVNAAQPDAVKDPFENFNRKIFGFNKTFDTYLLRPIASTYKKIVPTPIRRGVNNFFINLSTPWTAVNNLLQGHPGTSIESLSRFVINTVTTLGFYDTASYLGVERSDQDFGLTLGKWGVGSGPYVMLPFLGPSTVRDTLSRAVDQFGEPQSYIENTSKSLGFTGVKLIDLRSELLDIESLIQGDQYTLLRDFYLQRRQSRKDSAGKLNENPDATMNSDFGSEGFGDDPTGSVAPPSLDAPKSTNEESGQPINSIITDPVVDADKVIPSSSVTATPPAPF
jgi:ABC-type transporter lipoprotein component MlaA